MQAMTGNIKRIRRYAAVCLLITGFVLLILIVSSSIKTTGFGDILFSLALIISGMFVLPGASNNADSLADQKNQLTRSRARARTIISLLVIFYSFYAVMHIADGREKGCNTHSILMTMFPIRQLYFIPMVEREWNQGVGALAGESDNPLEMLGVALAQGLRDPIMDVVRYGDCQALYRLAGMADDLNPPRRTVNTTVARTTRPRATKVPTARRVSTRIPTVEPTKFTLTVITSDRLNVRAGPGTNFGKIGQLNSGDQVAAIGRNNSGSWIKSERGWLAGRYVDASGDIMALPVYDS